MNLFEEFSKDELRLTDVNLLPLDKFPWDFMRGAKTEKIFKTLETGEDRIRISYTYAYSDGNRVITPISKKYQFLNNDGTVGLEYDKPVRFSKKKLKAVHREIRQGQLDYLETGAEDLKEQADAMPDSIDQATVDYLRNAGQLPTWVAGPTEFAMLKAGMLSVYANIQSMFIHYDAEITSYINHGWRDFENAVNNETDPAILATLATTVRNPDSTFPNGLTSIQSIMYQLTGATP